MECRKNILPFKSYNLTNWGKTSSQFDVSCSCQIFFKKMCLINDSTSNVNPKTNANFLSVN